jgi:hypothetical protein
MKKTILLNSFLLLFLLSFLGKLNAQNIQNIECKQIGNSCNCKFKDHEGVVKHLNRTPNAKGKADVEIFWDFGDGTKEKGKAVSHTYKRSGDYRVRAFFKVKYSVYPAIPREESQIMTIKVAKEDPSVQSGNFALEHNLDGDIVMKEDFCLIATVPKAGDLTLDYNTTQFQISEIRSPLGATMSGNKIVSKGGQRIFMRVQALNLGENGQVAIIKAFWNGETKDVQFKVKASHDPNDMLVDRSLFKYDEFDGKTEIPVKYTVRFENIGGDIARNIKIRVALPKDMEYKPALSLVEYGYGSITENPRLPADATLPLCNSTVQDRCMEKIYAEKDDNTIGFDFKGIKLDGTNDPDKKKREGFVTYTLFIKKPPIEPQISSAQIWFDGTLKPIPTNVISVELKKQRRLSLRLAANTRLPANKDSILNYEIGLVWSRLYPFGFYFPTELGVSIKNQFWTDATAKITGIPVRFSQQIRHNFLGGLLGFGVGASVHIIVDAQRTEGSSKTMKFADFTDLQLFGDLNINALHQRPTLGLRFGLPVTKKFEAYKNANAQAQLYVAWQFK